MGWAAAYVPLGKYSEAHMATAFLLNPPRRRRKAHRSRSRARLRNSWFDDAPGHRRAALLGWRRRRRRRRGYVPASSYPRRARRRRHRRAVVASPSRRFRRRRRGSRRRRNPVDVWKVNPPRRRRARRGMNIAGLSISSPDVVPALRLPIPGIVGTLANSVVQGILAGSVVFGGYVASGAIVDMIVSGSNAEDARARGDKFRGYLARPLAFAGTAIVLGGLTSMVAPRGKRGLWSILAGAGPALRAFGGILYALLGGREGESKPGFVGKLAQAGKGISDYLQVGELYEAGMGDSSGSEGVSDYLQMDGIYEAGLGDEAEVEETESVGI